jgi:hypothetical protein
MYLNAQGFRSVFRNKMRELFDHVDVILAPTVLCPAIRMDQPTIVVAAWNSHRGPISESSRNLSP